MVRVSNVLIGTLNVLSATLSLSAIAISLYFRFHGGSECHKFIETPLLITGVVMFVVSIMGIMGSCGKMNLFLYLYLTVLFLCILGLIAFTVFAFIVTNEGAGKAISGRGYKEHKTGDYSNWMQNHIVNGKRWDRIKSCLVETHVCSKLAKQGGLTIAEFDKKKLSPIESGCCKPPGECGFEFKNATNWVVPKSGLAVPNSDCKTWSNQQNALCYDCDSCKGGFLGNIKQEWRYLLFFNIGTIVFVAIIYSTGCCASRNNRKDRKYEKYRGVYA
ncbi:tetraspanin-11 [Punica granatum]|uniref:Uncharacterized protein n=2 Tax=Punica granatum TaxID=22663 RepID=A0A218XZE9_PUNGR|nr:tetraspanin-11 [Punica granatum]OWM90334.1 hypothetical protein CDL15_Pgr014636 [Punica granatum]PKI70353.1 hypothetical protein CRG98_009233 [Punica granatum]